MSVFDFSSDSVVFSCISTMVGNFTESIFIKPVSFSIYHDFAEMGSVSSKKEREIEREREI
jgi:hypothetical protein